MNEENYKKLKKELFITSFESINTFSNKYDKNEIINFVTYAVENEKEDYFKADKNREYLYKLYTLLRNIIIDDYSVSKPNKKDVLSYSFKDSVLDTFASLFNHAKLY